jgi:aerobic-type carbon monoxide dehydrogenase small subunit (CoxS/CutS family)
MFKKLNEPVKSALTIYIDGEPAEAELGETVAAVILRQRSVASRTTPVHESPRAPFCMMGVCFDCLVIVDGVASTQSCLVLVQQGMRIERQFGRRSVLS